MGLISITLPTIGDPNSTEDVDIRNALNTIQTVINGGLDSANFAAAGIPFSKLTPLFLYGAVNGTTGAILIAGSGGWTSVKNSAGNYTVTFSPAFSAVPVFVASNQVGATSAFVVSALSATAATVATYTVSGAPASLDTNVHFHAIGVR